MTVEKVDFYGLSAEDVLKYLPMKDCGSCGYKTCREMAEALSAGKASVKNCPEMALRMSEGLAGPLSITLEVHEADSSMSTVPAQLIELNSPGPDSPVLVTGNCAVTLYVLKLIFDRVPTASAFVVPTDTKGFTVDHAAGMKLMTPMTVMRALTVTAVGSRVNHRKLLTPGLCKGMERQVEQMTRWTVEAGPVSGFELPAFLLEKQKGEQ
ncbi:MAG TPA: (Fe-S)-binding protein [Methanomassiliicoccales archaeon]|nr:(Fe-S)-binding protein [Methanomassiliicoccales archaeon]